LAASPVSDASADHPSASQPLGADMRRQPPESEPLVAMARRLRSELSVPPRYHRPAYHHLTAVERV
jgi:hypothetical protein